MPSPSPWELSYKVAIRSLLSILLSLCLKFLRVVIIFIFLFINLLPRLGFLGLKQEDMRGKGRNREGRGGGMGYGAT